MAVRNAVVTEVTAAAKECSGRRRNRQDAGCRGGSGQDKRLGGALLAQTLDIVCPFEREQVLFLAVAVLATWDDVGLGG